MKTPNTPLESSANRLYTLDTHGKELDKETLAILNILRQLINEEFIGKNKLITTQNLYNVLEDIL